MPRLFPKSCRSSKPSMLSPCITTAVRVPRAAHRMKHWISNLQRMLLTIAAPIRMHVDFFWSRTAYARSCESPRTMMPVGGRSTHERGNVAKSGVGPSAQNQPQAELTPPPPSSQAPRARCSSIGRGRPAPPPGREAGPRSALKAPRCPTAPCACGSTTPRTPRSTRLRRA